MTGPETGVGQDLFRSLTTSFLLVPLLQGTQAARLCAIPAIPTPCSHDGHSPLQKIQTAGDTDCRRHRLQKIDRVRLARVSCLGEVGVASRVPGAAVPRHRLPRS